VSTTISGETILQNVIRKGGIGTVLPNADIGAIAATTTTSVLHLRSAHYDTNTFRNKTAYRFRPGNATGIADYVRAVTTLVNSTGVLTHDATDSDTTLGAENIYMLYGVHPTWFVEDLNLALRRNYFANSDLLSLAADASFQSSATSSYTESDADAGPATTFTKVTTADSENVFPGRIASGRVANAATDGYIRQRFNVTPGKEVYVGALARADVGTASLVLYDMSNSAEINSGGVVQHTGEHWAYMWRQEAMPSGCEILEVRLQGEESTADIYWNGLWVQRVGERIVKLSSTWEKSAQFKIPALTGATFHDNVSSGVEVGYSEDKTEISRAAYDFDEESPGANPAYVQWHDTPHVGPIYIQGRRAYSDLTTFTLALSETTACDLDLITAATLRALYEDERVQAVTPDWQEKLGRWSGELAGQSNIHQATGPALRRAPRYIPRLSN